MSQASPLIGQYRTWYEHAIVAAVIPAGVVAWSGDIVAGFIASFAVWLFFLVREGWHYRDHKAAGDWTTPEERTGITPQADQHGDMVGPTTVMLVYLFLTVALAQP